MIGWTWPQDCWWCGHVVSGAWRPSEDQIISVCWCGLTNITNDITSFYKWHLTSTSCRKVEPKLEGGNCHQCYILPTEKKTGSRLLHWDDQQNINSLPELSACCMWRSHPANINSKWSQLRAVFCILYSSQYFTAYKISIVVLKRSKKMSENRLYRILPWQIGQLQAFPTLGAGIRLHGHGGLVLVRVGNRITE